MPMPAARLAGRVAAVTGASSGLGAAVARAFAAEGARVAGFARRFTAPRLAGPPAPAAVVEVRLDVTDEAAVVARFAELGPADVLVCAAGTGSFTPILATPAAELRALLDVHVTGAFLCAREALRAMAARRAGHIVMVSSIAALRTFPGSAAYTAAKEGLRGLTRVLVEEARAVGVRVTGLYPGAIDTPIWDGRDGFDRARMMRPEAVAALIVDLVTRPEVAVEELVVLPPAGAL